jgi:Dolichyl-phosphate-mannose-protein mannosyltransferase
VGRLGQARWGVVAPAALICFCTLWRLPSIGDPPWLNDEGTYANLGKAIFNGEAIYRQIWENKPPAIYLLYGVVHLLVGPAGLLQGVRLLALVAAIVSQIAIYRLTRPSVGRPNALLAVALAGLGLDLPILDGTSANAEIFMSAATTLGMALLWHALRRARDCGARDRDASMVWPTLAGAGMAFGVAIMFKLVSGADLLAALAMLLAFSPRRRGASMLALLLGACLPVCAVALWLAAQGLLGDALYATIGYNRGYVTTGQGMHGPVFSALLLAAPLALIGIAVRLARNASAKGRAGSSSAEVENAGLELTFAAAMCGWCGAALIGALASGRSYPHYFLEAVPPAAICIALIVRAASGGQDRRLRAALTILLVAWSLGVPAGSWAASIGQRANESRPYAYYVAAWQHITGRIDDTMFGNRIDPRVERNVAVARYLSAQPVNNRRLYVWGNTPWIYYLSGYAHAARFMSAYYNPPIPGGMNQVITSLANHPPTYIVMIVPALPASTRLSAFIRQRYRRVWSSGNAVVYRLR